MSDLISRADAVKAIRKCKFDSDMTSYWYRGMECAQNIVEQLPSAEAEWIPREHFDVLKKNYDMLAGLLKEAKARAIGAWIPCSERLPSESGDYICTIPLNAEETYTEVLTFHKGRFYEDDDEWGAIYHDDVLAWMPLPEPYERSNNE